MSEKLGSPLAFVAVGLLGIAIGTAIILTVTGMLPVQGQLQPGVTNWVVVCAGIVFASIGGVFALTGLSATKTGARLQRRAPWLLRLLNLLVLLLAFGSLATIATFAAIGPGPRAFTFSLPGLGEVAGAELIGRIFFGAIAILLWAVIAVCLWFGIKSATQPD
jgi:hypothetical protein